MNVHQRVQAAPVETSERWREAIRERWRVTLLSAWERDRPTTEGHDAACSKKIAFMRQKARLSRGNTGCKQ